MVVAVVIGVVCKAVAVRVDVGVDKAVAVRVDVAVAEAVAVCVAVEVAVVTAVSVAVEVGVEVGVVSGVGALVWLGSELWVASVPVTSDPFRLALVASRTCAVLVTPVVLAVVAVVATLGQATVTRAAAATTSILAHLRSRVCAICMASALAARPPRPTDAQLSAAEGLSLVAAL